MPTTTTTAILPEDQQPTFTREMCEKFFAENKRVIITFKKKDGTIRKMYCSRSPEIIPEQFGPKENSNAPKKPDTNMPVFDIDANGWRSFNIASLISMEIR